MLFPVSWRLWGRAYRPGRRLKRAARRRAVVPRLEALEDRNLPSTYTVLNLADSGPGSLRQAVLDANAHPGADVIRFANRLQGTIALTGGELSITDDLTIAGPGEGQLTISGQNVSRVFHLVGNTTHVAIDDLTVADGRTSGTTATGPNGPVTLGGGIFNEKAQLTLSHVTLANNQATGFIGAGGGVANVFGATLTVEYGTFTGNRAAGTGVDGPGGGIFGDAGSAVTVLRSTFTGNQAIDGGGIAIYGGSSATVSHSTFANNLARSNDGGPGLDSMGSSNGGAIFATDESLLGPLAAPTLTVSYSTFTGNQARGGDGGAGGAGVAGGNGGQGAGGAISIGASKLPSQTTVADISHCVFTDNRSIGGNGGAGGSGADGGAGNAGDGGALSQAGAALTLTDSTFVGNQAVGGAGGAGGAGSNGGNGGRGRGGAFVHTVAGPNGADFHPLSDLDHVTMRDNQATGGAGGAGGIRGSGGNGGDGQGGAIRALLGTINVSHGLLSDNQATGGAGGAAGAGSSHGGDGGNGQGGGFLTAFGATAVLSDTTLRQNQAIGGAGAAGGNGGAGQGGGIFNGGPSPFGAPSLTLLRSRVLLNEADGGAAGAGGSAGSGQGGGVYVSAGSKACADLATVIVRNRASTSDDEVFGILAQC